MYTVVKVEALPNCTSNANAKWDQSRAKTVPVEVWMGSIFDVAVNTNTHTHTHNTMNLHEHAFS